MKSRIYRRTPRGSYEYSWLHYSWLWIIVLLLIFGLNILLYAISEISFFTTISAVSLLFVGIILSVELVKLVIKLNKSGNFVHFIQCLGVEKSVRKALLNTMNLNMVKESPKIEVPWIKATISGDQLRITIQRLPGMYDLDKLTQDVNSSLKGKFKGYAVIEAIQEEDGSKFNFTLEDVSTNLTFCPKSVAELEQKRYFVHLQENLTINLAEAPHIAVWGQSGSGKTTVLMAIIAECLSNGSDLYFIDGKTEFSSFSVFYSSEKIATDNDKVLQLLKHVSEIIMKRQKTVADAVKKREQLGLKGFDIKMNPVILIADEIGSVKASMSSKEKKEFDGFFTQIAQKGRSVSVFLVVASQSPAVDVLPQGIRSQFSTKILLGSASGDVQRMAFGQVATAGNVPKFQGYYTSNGRTIAPQKFFVPDLFTYKLETMQAFKELYEKGKGLA